MSPLLPSVRRSTEPRIVGHQNGGGFCYCCAASNSETPIQMCGPPISSSSSFSVGTVVITSGLSPATPPPSIIGGRETAASKLHKGGFWQPTRKEGAKGKFTQFWPFLSLRERGTFFFQGAHAKKSSGSRADSEGAIHLLLPRRG